MNHCAPAATATVLRSHSGEPVGFFRLMRKEALVDYVCQNNLFSKRIVIKYTNFWEQLGNFNNLATLISLVDPESKLIL